MKRRGLFAYLCGVAGTTAAVGEPSINPEEGANSPTAITVNAMSADEFVAWAKRNPDAIARAMLHGLQSGASRAVTDEIEFRNQLEMRR